MKISCALRKMGTFVIVNGRVIICIKNNMFILNAGETGLGKSTLMDSLFNTNFESTPSPHNLPTVKLKAHTYELQESNVRLKVKYFKLILI